MEKIFEKVGHTNWIYLIAIVSSGHLIVRKKGSDLI